MASSNHYVVLTSSPDGPITAFDGASGNPLRCFTGSRSPTHGLALVGNSFIAASHVSPNTASSCSIHLYNWWASTALHTFPLPEPVAPLAPSFDGLYLFCGGLSGCIYVLSIPSGDIIKAYSSAHNKPVSCLKISEDGSLLLSGSDDGSIAYVPIFQLVDASTSTSLMVQRFVAHDGSVTAIQQCSSGITISCSLDCTLKIWGLFDGTSSNFRKTMAFPCALMGVALDLTNTEFFAAGSDGFIYKGSLIVGKTENRGQEFIRWPQKHETGIVSLVLVNERKNLISASEDGKVYIRDNETGLVITALGNDMGCISDMVVATGIRQWQGSKLGKRSNDCCHGYGYGGLSAAELGRSLKDTLDIEQVLRVAGMDRSRAIDMLESAISMYERLLELILKEAKKKRIIGDCSS